MLVTLSNLLVKIIIIIRAINIVCSATDKNISLKRFDEDI